MVFNKIKLIIFLLFISMFSLTLNAEQVEVTADNFFADEVKLESVLTGNVKMKKGSFDTLNSDKIYIYFDKDRNPIKYKATGNARFNIMIKENEYKGKGDILTYNPNTNIYTLEGNAHINELTTKREVFGDKITISQDNGKYEVESLRNSKNPNKKPARLIFKIEDKD